MMVAPVKTSECAAPVAKDNFAKAIILPVDVTVTADMSNQLDKIKQNNVQRAVEIALAIVGLDGVKPESFAREWPDVDIPRMLADTKVSSRVDAWAEHPVIENYARACQERRIAQKALSVIEAVMDAPEVSQTQARETIDLLTRGRQVKEAVKPTRTVRFELGTAVISTPFGITSVIVVGRDSGEAFLEICQQAYVRNDVEIAAIVQLLKSPMSRVTLTGW